MEFSKSHELLTEYKRTNDTIGDGYWRFIDVDKLQRYVNKYSGGDVENFYPFALSVFGEILVIENREFITHIDGPTGRVSIISNTIREFFKDTLDDGFMDNFFRIALFNQAKVRLGPIADNQCYAFTRLLQLNGTETIDNLNVCDWHECLSFF